MKFFKDCNKFFKDKKTLLKKTTSINSSNRILYHHNSKFKFHLMMICHHKNQNLIPFKFKSLKTKFFIHLNGKAMFLFYNYRGVCIKRLDFNNKNPFILLDESVFFYKQIVLSNKIIFFEATNGPFISKNKNYLKVI